VKKIFIAGSTGSIGRQALEVIRKDPQKFKVVALSANSSSEILIEQAREFLPEVVLIKEQSAYEQVKQALGSLCEVTLDQNILDELCARSDLILNAVVGFAGLPVTIAALKKNKQLALANKESLISAGELVKSLLSFSNQILPVDSEHCAIFQCLKNEDKKDVSKLVITSSGGPFRGYKKEELKRVSVDQALSHPTWKMGPKITIDSSTLMNKGLEIIEAHFLFSVNYDAIDVVIHPESIVHSLVCFTDGVSLAQLSKPDMRAPISYALYYPNRSHVSFGSLDFSMAFNLRFEPPDKDVFNALDLAYYAGALGGCAPTWLNAANEVAVEAFLNSQINWLDIMRVVEYTLNHYQKCSQEALNAILDADLEARTIARQILNKLSA
jgi:1-deoxy-D-xylulose-5-phosphate reductoisomerase